MNRSSEFPLILGRDFSGDIVDMGCAVDRSIYRTGDTVSCSNEISVLVTLDLSVSMKLVADSNGWIQHGLTSVCCLLKLKLKLNKPLSN